MEFIPGPAIHWALCNDLIAVSPDHFKDRPILIRQIIKDTDRAKIGQYLRRLSAEQASTDQRSASYMLRTSPIITRVDATTRIGEPLPLCLKQFKGLGKVHLTQTHFIWTEMSEICHAHIPPAVDSEPYRFPIPPHTHHT